MATEEILRELGSSSPSDPQTRGAPTELLSTEPGHGGGT